MQISSVSIPSRTLHLYHQQIRNTHSVILYERVNIKVRHVQQIVYDVFFFGIFVTRIFGQFFGHFLDLRAVVVVPQQKRMIAELSQIGHHRHAVDRHLFVLLENGESERFQSEIAVLLPWLPDWRLGRRRPASRTFLSAWGPWAPRSRDPSSSEDPSARPLSVVWARKASLSAWPFRSVLFRRWAGRLPDSISEREKMGWKTKLIDDATFGLTEPFWKRLFMSVVFSANILGITNINRDINSKRLFCRGVPVSKILFLAWNVSTLNFIKPKREKFGETYVNPNKILVSLSIHIFQHMGFVEYHIMHRNHFEHFFFLRSVGHCCIPANLDKYVINWGTNSKKSKWKTSYNTSNLFHSK